MKIKIFGERNTGTNALLQMLKINSDSVFYPGAMSEISKIQTNKVQLAVRMGLDRLKKESMIDAVFDGRNLTERWKHSATYIATNKLDEIEDSRFIFTVRNPLSWLIGLYKNPYHILVKKPASLVEFADIDWRVVRRENLSRDFYKPLELLEEKLKSYLSLIEKLEKKRMEYKVVKFEDFVVSQKTTFENLKEFLDSPSVKFSTLTKSTKESSKDYKYYSFYYTNEIWRDDFPEVDNIKKTVSRDILSFFGYE